MTSRPRPCSARPTRLRWRDKVGYLQKQQESDNARSAAAYSGDQTPRAYGSTVAQRAASESGATAPRGAATPRGSELGRATHMRWRDKLHFLQEERSRQEDEKDSKPDSKPAADPASGNYHPQHIRWRNKVAMLQKDEVVKPPMIHSSNPLGEHTQQLNRTLR